jgi:hypothetical protein
MGLFDFLRRKPQQQSVLEALQSSPSFQQQKELFDAMSAMCEDGVDADEMSNGTGEYGLTAANPIPCRTVFGSTGYLGRLRAADGAKVAYERLGSTKSSVSPHPVDIYEVKHPNGRKLSTLYISPYQKRISAKAPRGFILAENSFAQASPVRNVVTEADGTVRYFSCGVLHREDGPAVIEVYPDYDGQERHRSWYRFGVLDREDGPAVVGGRTANGQYEWWRAGVRHRDDGPAVIELISSIDWGSGPVYEWWHNDIRYKVQDGDGTVYHYNQNDQSLRLMELPDGYRVIQREGKYWIENADGRVVNKLDLETDTYPIAESYQGYLKENVSSHTLYEEPQATFDTYNPALEER